MNTDKKKVLILHGWMHSAARYEKLKEDLERRAGVSVTLYEFPGFGDTPARYEKDILENYCRDLGRYLKAHDFDYVIGHSMGGAVALRAAAACLRETFWILLSPEYGGIPLLKPWAFVKPLVRPALDMAKRKNRVCALVIKVMSLFTVNRYSRIDDRIVEDVRRADSGAACELMFELAKDRWSVKEDSGLGGKMLLIIGEKDRLIPRPHMLRLKGQLGCEMDVLKGIGHTAVLEDYEGLLELLCRCVALR